MAIIGIVAYDSVMLADGMIIIWAPSSTPPPATYGGDLNAEDMQYEKEYWKPRTTFRSVFDSHRWFLPLVAEDLTTFYWVQVHNHASV